MGDLFHKADDIEIGTPENVLQFFVLRIINQQILKALAIFWNKDISDLEDTLVDENRRLLRKLIQEFQDQNNFNTLTFQQVAECDIISRIHTNRPRIWKVIHDPEIIEKKIDLDIVAQEFRNVFCCHLEKYKIFVHTFFYQNALWIRISYTQYIIEIKHFQASKKFIFNGRVCTHKKIGKAINNAFHCNVRDMGFRDKCPLSEIENIVIYQEKDKLKQHTLTTPLFNTPYKDKKRAKEDDDDDEDDEDNDDEYEDNNKQLMIIDNKKKPLDIIKEKRRKVNSNQIDINYLEYNSKSNGNNSLVLREQMLLNNNDHCPTTDIIEKPINRQRILFKKIEYVVEAPLHSTILNPNLDKSHPPKIMDYNHKEDKREQDNKNKKKRGTYIN